MPRQHDRTGNFPRTSLFLIVCALFVPGAGCGNQHYYRVVDSQSQQVYYTHQVDHPKDMPNTAKFVDARTGQTVTLDRMTVDALTKEQFASESGVTPKK